MTRSKWLGLALLASGCSDGMSRSDAAGDVAADVTRDAGLADAVSDLGSDTARGDTASLDTSTIDSSTADVGPSDGVSDLGSDTARGDSASLDTSTIDSSLVDGNFDAIADAVSPESGADASADGRVDTGPVDAGPLRTQLQLQFRARGSAIHLETAILASNGDYVLSGAELTSPIHAIVIRVDVRGSIVWQYTYGPAGSSTRFSRTVELPDHDLLLVGHTGVSTAQRGVAMRLAPDGTPRFLRSYADATALSVAEWHQDGYVMVGGAYNSPRALVMALNDNGTYRSGAAVAWLSFSSERLRFDAIARGPGRDTWLGFSSGRGTSMLRLTTAYTQRSGHELGSGNFMQSIVPTATGFMFSTDCFLGTTAWALCEFQYNVATDGTVTAASGVRLPINPYDRSDIGTDSVLAGHSTGLGTFYPQILRRSGGARTFHREIAIPALANRDLVAGFAETGMSTAFTDNGWMIRFDGMGNPGCVSSDIMRTVDRSTPPGPTSHTFAIEALTGAPSTVIAPDRTPIALTTMDYCPP